MNIVKRVSLTILALLGFILSVKLSLIYIDANFNPYALSSFCSINEFIDCDGVARTSHSQFFGIPLAFWGLFLYFLFLFFTYVDKIKELKFLGFLRVFKNPESYICALGLISFAISMLLFGISIFEIKKLCVLCLCTYILNLFIALAAKPSDEGFISVFKTSFTDFIDSLKVKRYAISFSILVLIAAAFLTYTTVTDVFAPQVKKLKQLEEIKKQSYNATGNVLGDPKATLTVYEYTDYQCPFCFVLNTMLYRAVNELSNLKVVHQNLPLDMNCNTRMTEQMHEGSCILAKYVIAAGLQGKYWDMNSFLFDNEVKEESTILNNAAKLHLDVEKLKEDAHSEKVAKMLQEEMEQAYSLGIDGTPGLQINMETHIGIMPYEDLKAKLIKAGAKERK